MEDMGAKMTQYGPVKAVGDATELGSLLDRSVIRYLSEEEKQRIQTTIIEMLKQHGDNHQRNIMWRVIAINPNSPPPVGPNYITTQNGLNLIEFKLIDPSGPPDNGLYNNVDIRFGDYHDLPASSPQRQYNFQWISEHIAKQLRMKGAIVP